MTETKGAPTRLRITSCESVYHGQNERGDQFTIYEVGACKPDGTVVEHKLRSFESLPLEELDLIVKPFHSDQHGKSYTLSRRDKPNVSAVVSTMQGQIAELQQRVAALEGKAPKPQAGQATSAELDARYGSEPPY